ncbi:DNA adenine methylase [Tumebacillus avium]|nr:DNA adenine methylase [Tumebacillus avium]
MYDKRRLSPLRYPGAKGRVLDKISKYMSVEHVEYREPFVGGGSVFLSKMKVERNWINDRDELVAALWQVIRDTPESLCEYVELTLPTVDYWREVKRLPEVNLLEKAYKCLFLNRTNYSGILKANPIGGIEQKSKYPIDCRWNPNNLIKRIMLCSEKLQGTNITSLDFRDVIEAAGDEVLMFVDPPYYKKGHRLYPTYMSNEEHHVLAQLLQNTNHRFLLTIDNCEEVQELYRWANMYIAHESWFYTIKPQNGNYLKGNELFISNFDIEEV